MRICVIQLAYADQESIQARTERVVGLIKANADHDLMVLPELWSAGGFDYSAWTQREQTVDGQVTQALAQAARDAGVVLHTGTIVEHHPSETGAQGRGVWNTSVVLGPDGEIEATYRKIHRFGFGQGEPTLMEAGTDLVVTDLPDPAGALTVGLSTCYDLRFPELYRAQATLGAELFIIPAAWPMARVDAWSLLARARAIENQAFVVAANTAGTHAATTMGGQSAIINPQGAVLAQAGSDEEILSVQIDPAEVAAWREKFPVLEDRRL